MSYQPYEPPPVSPGHHHPQPAATHGWPAQPVPPAPAPQGWPQPPEFHTPPPKRRTGLILAAAVVAGLLVLTGVGYVAWQRFGPDPGIAACEAMAAKKSPVSDSANRGGDKLTKAQYLELRDVFDGSRHDDIRTAGLKLVDVLWQISQIPEGEEFGALAFIGTATSAMTELTGACANHGIVVSLQGD